MKIQPYVDEGKLDEAGEELVKQLMGSKFSTGKMQNYCLTDASFRMCARVKKHVEDANARKKLEGKERRKDKQTATAESKLAAKNKNLQDITAFKECLLHRPGAQNHDRPCPCSPPTCKWLPFEICGNPACPEPVPKKRNCMKQVCRKWREDNDVALVVFLKEKQPARSRQRQTAARSDSDSSDDEDGTAAGTDLIGKKFLLSCIEDHAEGECLVTEPGVHTDEDTGEEFDMLWYQYQDPQSDEVLDECSAVAEVRQWVEKHDSIL